MGYNNRHKCLQFVAEPKKRSNWNDVKIIAFDAPLLDAPYSQRLDTLKQSTVNILKASNLVDIPSDHPILSVVNPLTCEGPNHLSSFFDTMIKKGAEGVVLRNPNAWYFKEQSFFKKEVQLLWISLVTYIKVYEESILMQVEPGVFKWYAVYMRFYWRSMFLL
jgi:hypothetical protein